MQCRVKSMAEGVFYTLWFEKNLQGDIVAVYDDAGNKLYSYAYDAWGNSVATRHSTSTAARYAQYNPFRYRGYYYDTETGFYYLQSRYYDPNTGRFLNADGQLNGGLLGDNQFAYCENNPVMNIDPTGTSWSNFWSALKEGGTKFVEAAVVVAAVGGAVLTVAAAVTGTVASGGAGAIAIPAAIVVASECLAVATATVAGVGAIAAVAGTIGENVSFDAPQRGVGGKGWRGDKTWRNNVDLVGQGGTITELNGEIPTKQDAIQLINESGGKVIRVEGPHDFPNPHTFNHINYITSNGTRGTIKILD